LFFFFQAEDGIRDDLVTGVQTCALPIFAFSASVGRLLLFIAAVMRSPRPPKRSMSSPKPCGTSETRVFSSSNSPPGTLPQSVYRSEERRVGKEWSVRWVPVGYTKEQSIM